MWFRSCAILGLTLTVGCDVSPPERTAETLTQIEEHEVLSDAEALGPAAQAFRETAGERIEAKAPIYVLNGEIVEADIDILSQLPRDGIASIRVLRGGQAVAAYGAKAKNGAIEIVTGQGSTN